jgi:hypothetical protein
MTTSDSAWATFLASSHGEGDLDLDALTQLEGPDREAARTELRRLLKANDSRAPEGFEQLADQEALPALRKAMEPPAPVDLRLRAAHAVWMLAQDESAVETIATLLSSGARDERVMAAFLLADLPVELASKPLANALFDKDAMVAALAFDGLLVAMGLGDLDKSQLTRLGTYFMRFASPLAAVRMRAADDLVRLMKRGRETLRSWLCHKIDETRPWLSAFTEQVQSTNRIDAVSLRRDLIQYEREWTEHTLISRILIDARTITALVELESELAIEPLRELAQMQGADNAAAAGYAVAILEKGEEVPGLRKAFEDNPTQETGFALALGLEKHGERREAFRVATQALECEMDFSQSEMRPWTIHGELIELLNRTAPRE